ncbi:MAG TPA: hypothetical protein VGG71_05105 [Chitinophagaceae bacterium]
MGKRKVTILEPAVTAVAEIAFFIESKGMPQTAKKFVREAFAFFEKLSDDVIEYKPCTYTQWRKLKYRCITYKKKYVVAYLSQEKEIIICDFVPSKLLK